MSITVRYFASVRDLVGKAEECVVLAENCTANDVWEYAANQAMPANLLVAINQEHARIEDAVNDGDEVAFFPPVTGG
ncbi:MAG: MoaD/ThiS family protein [Acidiferrobacterales bacterium]